MGKNNRHKKFLKSEKSKIKLKAKKLTKGQNVTDTSFKTKKIVLLSQSTTPEDQPQTRKKLSLKELLNRTKHYSATMKQDALSGLRELAVLHPETLSINLCSYFESSAALCIDPESAVRQESLRLLHYVLEKITTIQLEPFMPLLVSYLSVGMSHLNQDIQSDALRMLDLVLAVAPNLVAQAASSLLPAFLDQISVNRNNTTSGERNLSLNLQSSSTSARWRIKVLGRLHAMLCAVVTSKTCDKSAKENSKNVFYWTPTCLPYAPVYMWQWQLDQPCEIQGLYHSGNNTMLHQNLFKNEEEMKKYVTVLMPLLFDTWIEVGPSQKQQREEGSLITPEAAELLECVLEIIQHLWTYLQQTDEGNGNNMLTLWFQSHYRQKFVSNVMNHFPYCTSEEDKPKKRHHKKGQAPFEVERLRTCNSQNLAVCHIFCSLCNKPTQQQAQAVLDYTLKCMKPGQYISEQLLHVLQCILGSHQWRNGQVDVDITPLAQAAVSYCFNKQSKADSSTPLFSLLCDVSLESAKKNKESTVPDHMYEKFFEELPSVLKEGMFSAKALKTITSLAAMQNPSLLQGVKLYLPQIITKLSEMIVEGMDQKQVQSNVIAVLYRASVWRLDILDSVARCFLSDGVNVELRNHFRDLLLLEEEMNPHTPLSHKIKAMTWFTQQ